MIHLGVIIFILEKFKHVFFALCYHITMLRPQKTNPDLLARFERIQDKFIIAGYNGCMY